LAVVAICSYVLLGSWTLGKSTAWAMATTDNSKLVLGTDRGDIVTWDLYRKCKIAKFRCKYTSPVLSVALSSDCRYIAVNQQSGAVESVTICDSTSGAVICHGAAPKNTKAMQFTNGDESLVLFGDDIAMVDLKAKASAYVRKAANAEAGLCLEKAGILFGNGWGDISFCRTESLRKEKPDVCIAAHSSNITCIHKDIEANVVVVASLDKSLTFWAVPELTRLRSIRGHLAPVMLATLNSKVGLLASGDTSGTVKVWSIANNFEIGSVQLDQVPLGVLFMQHGTSWYLVLIHEDRIAYHVADVLSKGFLDEVK